MARIQASGAALKAADVEHYAMTRRVSGIANDSAAEEQNRPDETPGAIGDAPAESRVIPLNLGPLLAPYRKHGRLSLRIERLPQRARLSAGRNLGDGSWSLATDELDDLTYMFPQSVKKAHTLAIRVIRLDGAAAKTLAVLDFLVAPNGSAKTQDESPDGVAEFAHDRTIDRLREELAEAKAALAARDTVLATMRQDAQGADEEFSKEIEVELAAARAKWKTELDERLTAAAKHTAAEIQKRRAAWDAEQAERVKELEAGAEERISKERKRWENETESAIAKAEKSWKSGEAARLAEAEAKWREKEAKSAADARAKAGARDKNEDIELKRLRDESAALQVKLAEREVEIAKAKSAAAEKRGSEPREIQDALANAENAWKADEALRFAEAEAAWRKKTEKALADARAEAAAAHDKDADTQIKRLNDELATLQITLAERETAMAKAKSAAAKEREKLQQEADDALAKAKDVWNAEEAARLAAAEARWREQSAKAATDLRTEAAACNESGEMEMKRLADELAALRATLAERETTLAKAQVDGAEERGRLQRESKDALAKVKADAAAEREHLQRESADLLAKTKADAAKELENLLRESADLLAKAKADAIKERERLQRESADTLAKARESAAAERERLQHEHADALTKAIENAAKERECLERNSADALAALEESLKADASARLTAAEARWQAKAEKAATDARSESEAARKRNSESERNRHGDELAALQDRLDEREAALAQAESVAADERERLHREYQDALVKAERTWKAQEDARFTAARAQWREKSDKELAAARAKAAAVRSPDEGREIARLRNELETAQSILAERESELARATSPMALARERWQREADGELNETEQYATSREPSDVARRAKERWGMIRDVGLAAALAISVMVIYPIVEPMLPWQVRQDIAAITAEVKAVFGIRTPSAPPAPQVPDLEQGVAITTEAVNFRTGPSTAAAAILTLPQDREVTVLEERGDWMRVRIGGNGGNQAREGWVFGSFLEAASGGETVPEPTPAEGG